MKSNHSKQPTVKPPALMSEKLEKDMKAFLQERLKRGVSYTAAVRQMRRRFNKAITKELATNPETQKRVAMHMQRKQLQSYKPWARWIFRLILLFRRFTSKTSKP